MKDRYDNKIRFCSFFHILAWYRFKDDVICIFKDEPPSWKLNKLQQILQSKALQANTFILLMKIGFDKVIRMINPMVEASSHPEGI